MSFLNNKWFSFFFFKKTIFIFGLTLATLIISAYLGVRTPRLMQDLILHYSSPILFEQALFALAFQFLAVYINRVAYSLAVNKYVRTIIQKARYENYERWITSHLKESDRYTQGEVITRMMSDTESIRELVSSGALGLFIDLSFVLSALVSIMALHFKSGASVAAIELILLILLVWGSKLLRDYFISLRKTQALVNRSTANIVAGLQDLFYLSNRTYANSRQTYFFDRFLYEQNRVNTVDALYYAIAESCFPLMLLFMAIIFNYFQLAEAALIFAIVDLVQRSINPIKEVSGKMANLQRAHTGIERIIDFKESFSIKPKTLLHSNLNQNQDNIFLKDWGDLQDFDFKLHQFSYEQMRSNFSLKDIHLKGSKGDLLGIVGTSGSGKSTFLNILCGQLFTEKDFYQARLVFNRHGTLTEFIDSDVFAFFSLVSQDSHLFSESLFFNLSLGQVSMEDVKRLWSEFALTIPYLNKWNIQLEDKIDPLKLSLGQKQLLSGLRALILKKPIILFDEISSGLDPSLEEALRNLLQILQIHSLTIIVAHRIETIVSAQKIYVFDNGRVVESGKHDELMRIGPKYREAIEELSQHKN